MSNTTEKENKLFARWAQKYKDSFVKDGAPCPEQFENAKYKITFVLKEANDFKEPEMDMRKWVDEFGAETKYRNTWNNITRWTQAILEGGNYCQEITTNDRFHWLKQISFLNLKKVSGWSESDEAEIKKYAKKDKKFILEQLNIYKPDIIVCCGKDWVSDCLADFVFYIEKDWEHPAECFYTQIPGKTERTAVLNFYHPLNRGTGYTNEKLFDAISEISKKILDGR